MGIGGSERVHRATVTEDSSTFSPSRHGSNLHGPPRPCFPSVPNPIFSADLPPSPVPQNCSSLFHFLFPFFTFVQLASGVIFAVQFLKKRWDGGGRQLCGADERSGSKDDWYGCNQQMNDQSGQPCPYGRRLPTAHTFRLPSPEAN